MNTPPQSPNYLFNNLNMNAVHYPRHFFVQLPDIKMGDAVCLN